ncbi:MAG: hypothetical protein J6U92_05280, partial [Clostridia bacterium]|nr:hypothetical protein [Clostridia bacterium]
TGLVTITGLIVNKVFNNKPASDLLKSIAKVTSKLPNLIKTAEKLGGTGEEKKAYVMEQVGLYFTADGVKPTEKDLTYISTTIDNQVKLTKELHTVDVKTTKDNVEVTTHVDVKTDIGVKNGEENIRND